MTTLPKKPLPVPDEDTKPFWQYCKQHELRMQRCANCGHFRYPPNFLCPQCHSGEAEWVRLSGKGRVHTFTIVHQLYHPAFADKVPYCIAIIQLEEGPRLMSNVVGCRAEDVKVDMPVEVIFEDVSEVFALPQFRPL